MRVFKKGNSNTKRSAYKPLVRPILEYGASFWDPYREGSIIALDHVQEEMLNMQIIRTIRSGKLWRSVESSAHLRPVQNIHRRIGMKVYMGRVKRTMLPERR
jgi:hypothetical protein